MKTTTRAIAACLALVTAVVMPTFAFDYSEWRDVLSTYVQNGEVDYAALAQAPEPLDQYLDRLAQLDPAELQGMAREEAIAFWINVHNAIALRLLLDGRDTAEDHFDYYVAGVPISLTEIRRDKLLQPFRDERIHFALATGAASGPTLLDVPYEARRLEMQLTHAAWRFVNDPAKNILVRGAQTLYLSKMFKWFGRDFMLHYGNPQQDTSFSPEEFAALNFIADHVEDDLRAYLEAAQTYSVEYLEYNWSLLETSSPPSRPAS